MRSAGSGAEGSPLPSQLPQAGLSRLDRAIAAVAPRYALQRYESRLRLEAATLLFGPGGYSGARRERPALKNWRPWNHGPMSAVSGDLWELRARTGDLERNDAVAAGAIATNVTSTIGAGIHGRAQVDRKYLGLTDAEAEALNEQIDRVVGAHAESKAWDYEGRQDFVGQQELAFRGALSRGDVFVVRRFVERPGDLLATRFQLIEGDRVSTPWGQINSLKLVDGVALDDALYPLGYWIENSHPGDTRLFQPRTWTFVAADGQESGTWRVRHVYRQQRAGQVRGVPMLATVIELLKQLSRLSEAELMGSVINSLFTVFVKSDTGGVDIADLQGATTPPVAATPSTQQRQLDLGSGLIVGLAPGEDVAFADPKRPNAQFEPYFLAIVRQIGAAIETPASIILKHFDGSYSTARAEFMEFWRAVMTKRRWFVRDYCAPCREALIEEAVTRELIAAPRFFTDPLARRAYCQARWTGPGMGQLNPVDETNAAKLRVDAGFSSIDEEAAAINGNDFEMVHVQRAKEHALRVAAHLEPETLNVVVRGQANEGVVPPGATSDPAKTPPPGTPSGAPKQVPAKTDTADPEDPGARHAA